MVAFFCFITFPIAPNEFISAVKLHKINNNRVATTKKYVACYGKRSQESESTEKMSNECWSTKPVVSITNYKKGSILK